MQPVTDAAFVQKTNIDNMLKCHFYHHLCNRLLVNFYRSIIALILCVIFIYYFSRFFFVVAFAQNV